VTFIELGVPADLAAVLQARGITIPTPILAATLPDSLAGRDVLGRGRTGSGKTYAFLLPLVARLAGGARAKPGRPRALVLAPTRELVGQIKESLDPLARRAGLRVQTVFGGVGQGAQVAGLRAGADIVLACPGRLEDLIAQRLCTLDGVEITVLDEADHMADLGFLPAVRRLLDGTPAGGQRLLFSATLDQGVGVLVKRYLHDEVVHEADSARSPVASMDHHVLRIERDLRLPVILDLASAPGRTVVFTRTKHGAKGLARQLNRSGVPAVELHGNLSQNARVRNLDAFHSGAATTLVATDIAARGIHVDDVALVVHADPPAEHKAYLHRSGRTARAGAAGTVVTLMTAEQAKDVRDLTRAAGIKPTITTVDRVGHPVLVAVAPGERSTPGGFMPVSSAGSEPQRGSAGQRANTRRPTNRTRTRRPSADHAGGTTQTRTASGQQPTPRASQPARRRSRRRGRPQPRS